MAPNKQNTAETRKKLAANLQVLRRYDEHIQAIVGTTSHVVLYQFQQESSTWAKKDVEGALFLFERSSAPHYGFMVMNRLGIDNYTELLGPQISIQPTDEFLIYRQSDGAVMGIWIYEEADRKSIATQMEE
ncbi:PH domain-like protein, partial [Linderina pennispora]